MMSHAMRVIAQHIEQDTSIRKIWHNAICWIAGKRLRGIVPEETIHTLADDLIENLFLRRDNGSEPNAGGG